MTPGHGLKQLEKSTNALNKLWGKYRLTCHLVTKDLVTCTPKNIKIYQLR